MELAATYLFLPFGVLLVLGLPIAFALIGACIAFIAFAGTPVPFAILVTELAASLYRMAIQFGHMDGGQIAPMRLYSTEPL